MIRENYCSLLVLLLLNFFNSFVMPLLSFLNGLLAVIESHFGGNYFTHVWPILTYQLFVHICNCNQLAHLFTSFCPLFSLFFNVILHPRKIIKDTNRNMTPHLLYEATTSRFSCIYIFLSTNTIEVEEKHTKEVLTLHSCIDLSLYIFLYKKILSCIVKIQCLLFL